MALVFRTIAERDAYSKRGYCSLIEVPPDKQDERKCWNCGAPIEMPVSDQSSTITTPVKSVAEVLVNADGPTGDTNG
jgi:hypothetical protein